MQYIRFSVYYYVDFSVNPVLVATLIPQTLGDDERKWSYPRADNRSLLTELFAAVWLGGRVADSIKQMAPTFFPNHTTKAARGRAAANEIY